MRPFALCCLGILASALALTAHASPITITESFTADGSFDGTSFTDQTISFGGSGDTSDVENLGGGFFELATTSNFLEIGSGPSYSFTNTPLDAFVFGGSNDFAGFFGTDGTDIADVTSAAFSTYQLDSSISASGTGNPSDYLLPTSGGNFEITAIDSDVTYSAVVSTGAPIPEPPSLLLLATGALGLAGATLRRARPNCATLF